MNLKKLLAGATLSLAMFSALEANAQQNLNVSATVPDVCVITAQGTALNLNFDLSTLNTATTDFTASVDFLWRCSLGTAATINLDSGGSTNADADTRYMTGPGGEELAYILTSPDNVAWGDGTNGQGGYDDVGEGMLPTNEIRTPINGTIPLAAAQAATVGTYTDVVTVTLLP